MSEVESLAKDVSSNLTVAATIEEDGTDDALANFTVIDQPMTTEEATDVPRPADDAFEADKENNGVQHGGLQRRSGDPQDVCRRNLPSNQPPCGSNNPISAPNHHCAQVVKSSWWPTQSS